MLYWFQILNLWTLSFHFQHSGRLVNRFLVTIIPQVDFVAGSKLKEKKVMLLSEKWIFYDFFMDGMKIQLVQLYNVAINNQCLKTTEMV